MDRVSACRRSGKLAACQPSQAGSLTSKRYTRCGKPAWINPIVEIYARKTLCFFLCHSERSEESLISSIFISMRGQPITRDPSYSLRMTGHEGRSYQTALAKIAEITTGGALHQVYGELEQTNFPRVVYAVDNRAQRFVFVFHLPPGAIDHRVD